MHKAAFHLFPVVVVHLLCVDYLDQVNTALELIARMKGEMFHIETSHAARERVRRSIQMDHAHIFRHSSSASLFGIHNLWETASQVSSSSSHAAVASERAPSERNSEISERERDRRLPLFNVNTSRPRSRWDNSRSRSLPSSIKIRSRSPERLTHSISLPNLSHLRSLKGDFDFFRHNAENSKRHTFTDTQSEGNGGDLNAEQSLKPASKLAKRLSPDFDMKDAAFEQFTAVENTPELTRVTTPEETLVEQSLPPSVRLPVAHANFAAYAVSDPCATSLSPVRRGRAAAPSAAHVSTPEGHASRPRVPRDDCEQKVEGGMSADRPDSRPPAPPSRSNTRSDIFSPTPLRASSTSPTNQHHMAQFPSPISALDSFMRQSPSQMDISALSTIDGSRGVPPNPRPVSLPQRHDATNGHNMFGRSISHDISPTSAPPARKRRRPVSAHTYTLGDTHEAKQPPDVSRILHFGGQSPPKPFGKHCWPAPPLLSPALSLPKHGQTSLVSPSHGGQYSHLPWRFEPAGPQGVSSIVNSRHSSRPSSLVRFALA